MTSHEQLIRGLAALRGYNIEGNKIRFLNFTGILHLPGFIDWQKHGGRGVDAKVYGNGGDVEVDLYDDSEAFLRYLEWELFR
jgi:N-acetylglucosamine-6-phosphate deacetylase